MDVRLILLLNGQYLCYIGDVELNYLIVEEKQWFGKNYTNKK